MNIKGKKINAFGKSIPVIAIVLMVLTAGIAGAALADHLSNTIKTEITVTSPMVVSISEGYKASWSTTQCVRPDTGAMVDSFLEGQANSDLWSTTTVEISDVTGGETITVYLMSENTAKAEIMGFEEAIVTNPLGVTSADFESITVRVDSIYGDLGYGDPTELISEGGCTEIKWDTIRLGSPELSTWGEGETDVTEIVVTFEEAASGTYTLTYRVVPEAPTN